MSLHRQIATVLLLSFVLGLGACSPSTTDTKDTSTNVNSGKEANSKAQNKTLDSDSELYKTVVAGLGDGKNYTYTPGKGAPDITNFVVEKDPLGRPIVKATITNNYTMKLPLDVTIGFNSESTFLVGSPNGKLLIDFAYAHSYDKVVSIEGLNAGESNDLTFYMRPEDSSENIDANDLKMLVRATLHNSSTSDADKTESSTSDLNDRAENHVCTKDINLDFVRNDRGKIEDVMVTNFPSEKVYNFFYTLVNNEGVILPDKNGRFLIFNNSYRLGVVEFTEYTNNGYTTLQVLYAECKN